MNINSVKNVSNYTIGFNSFNKIYDLIYNRFNKNDLIIIFIDSFFKSNNILNHNLNKIINKKIFYIETKEEPTTTFINNFYDHIKNIKNIKCIIGIGGGITLDSTKAISNLLTNKGKAEDYQGWNLLKKPGLYKIGIPTISGTGAEATKTCVMTNKNNGLKLGMNSDFTVFDEIILDPVLTKTVPRDQYFYTGMDAYIHCIESINGNHRNSIGDSLSLQTISLCEKIFLSNIDMMTDENRMNLMVASYLGGCAIATSYVGLIHPLSAGLSVVLNTHHCISNCIVMRSMKEFYPNEYEIFFSMVENQKINIPKGICNKLTDSEFKKLYDATIIHEKPLKNALGENYKKILTLEKTTELFKMM